MTKHSNELVALEWLIEPLNQELDALHAYAGDSAPDLLIHFARGYQPLSNILLMANLPEFTRLAQTISKASAHFATIKNPSLLAPKIAYASHLLQYEINRYANTGYVRRPLLNSRIHYLELVRAHFGGDTDEASVILESVMDERFSNQLNLSVNALTPLDDKSYQEINQAWKVLLGQLVQSGVNGDQLNKLRNISTHLAAATSESVLQKLWLMAVLWLENTALNKEPLPHYYAHVLGELDRAIAFQKANIALEFEANMWLESLIADMYIMLATLKTHNETAQNFLKNHNDRLADDQSFFPHVLSTIDGILFTLADNKIDLHSLSALQEQLSVRGWSFYARYVEQIISDAKVAQDDDTMFTRVQWQLNTQLQDLHTAILGTAQIINAKENEYDTTRLTGERDVIREARSSIESIKEDFAAYLQTKNTDDLPKPKNFTSLSKNFEDMGLFDAANVITKMSEIFTKLEIQALPHIHWQFAHKIAESLALFEMFLNNLTQQMFDYALLTRVDEHIDESINMLNQAKATPSEFFDAEKERQIAHQYAIVYDDLGEHQPNHPQHTEGNHHSFADTPTKAIDATTDIDSIDINELLTRIEHHADHSIEETPLITKDAAPTHAIDETHSSHELSSEVTHQDVNNDALANLTLDELSLDNPTLEILDRSSEHLDHELLMARDISSDDTTSPKHHATADPIYDDVMRNDGSDDELALLSADTEADDDINLDDELLDTVSADLNVNLDDNLHSHPNQDESTDNITHHESDATLLAGISSDDEDDKTSNHQEATTSDEIILNTDTLVDLSEENQLIDADLFGSDNINLNLNETPNDDDEQLIVDDLSDKMGAGQSDELYYSDNPDEILLSDYINEGTVDNVVPNLVSSDLLSEPPKSASKSTLEAQTVMGAEADIKAEEIDVIDDADDVDVINDSDGVQNEAIEADDTHDTHDIGSVALPIEDGLDNTKVLTDDFSSDDDSLEDDTTSSADLSERYLTAKASLKEDDFSHDEEIRNIFIEEADEVMEEMCLYLPKWQADPQNLKVLKEIRRNWHTLKGSGCMVGALQLGETAWAIENLLNRVLDDTIQANPDVVTTVSDAADIIPVMVQSFANLQPPSVDNALVIMRANNLLAGRPMDEGAPSVTDGNVMPAHPQKTPARAAPLEAAPLEEEPTLHVAHDDVIIADGDDNHDELNGLIDSPTDDSTIPDVLLPFIEAAKAVAHNPVQMDDDIREIYIEEAREVLDEITPLFHQYQDNPNKASLIEVRRGFHTLKGSGRMVGASELGELAWSIENMLNRVLEDITPMNNGMMRLIHDVFDEFDALVSLFEAKSDEYPAKIQLWEACAHAYSEGHGAEFDYRQLGLSSTPSPTNTTDDHARLLSTDEVDARSTAQNGQITQTTDESLTLVEQAIGQLMADATPILPAADDEENQLCQIFIEEAKQLLTDVTAFLDEHEHDDKTPVDNSVVRAFHTLRGALGLSPLIPIGEVGEIIERGLQHLQRHDMPMDNRHKQALKNSVTLINGYLDDYNHGLVKGPHAEHDLEDMDDNRQQIEDIMSDGDDVYQTQSLVEGIDNLLDAELELEVISAQPSHVIAESAKTQLSQIELLSSRTLDLPKFQSLLAALKSAYELLLEHTEQAKDDVFIDALLMVHHELIGLFDAMAGSMSLEVDKNTLAHLNAITLERENDYQNPSHDTTSQETDHASSTTQSFTTQLSYDSSLVRLETIDTDDELLDIFLEEALEIDAKIIAVFGRWREDKNNLEHLKALQRHLHTLKGGARLAGIVSIGDLTHEAESVYERFANRQMAVTEAWIQAMQRVQDVLSLQLEAVKNTKQSFFADNTVADLQAYLSSSKSPEDAPISVPLLETKVAVSTDTPKTKEEVTPPAPVTTDDKAQYEALIRESWQDAVPDRDILAVFLEESKELAESSSEDFALFRNNTSDVTSLQSLQRKLHTIKGGARMISANGMADLAHEMETIYEELGNRRLPPTRMVTNLLFACHDWIITAIELLENHYNPPRPTPLIEALTLFIKNPDSLNEVPMVSLEKEIAFIHEYQSILAASGHARDISHMPPMKGVFGESVDSSSNNEMIRISAPLLERMINLSGEATINRTRIDMNLASITGSIEEMGITVQRLFDQLRRMDIELEEQILSQIDDTSLDEGFDPLEMDQYSSLNQLSKSLSESASDLLDIKATMLDKTRDGENLLLQLSRTQTDLQDSLMSSRMVPFSRLTPRLQRIVRQTAGELGKNVDLKVINADDQMDRNILDHITSPLEHMLRNAVDHGIESPSRRAELGKPFTGHITLEVLREGGEMVIILSDDGAGINVEVVRQKAISQGLIQPDEQLSNNDIMQYIFNAGLSTTNKVTQISGRGVGMDVVRTEIRQLGGSVSVESEPNRGSRFIIRVPLTVAVSDVLIVRVADRQYAVPLTQIERVVQVNASTLLDYHQSDDNTIKIDNRNYRLRYLNEILTGHHFNEIMLGVSLPVIIIKTQTGQALALQVDEIVGSRIEIVVKPLGRQLSHLSGISAATIMGDGSVMLILDLLALMRTAQTKRAVKEVRAVSRRHLIMVVDDSVTVRKVTSRFLEREGFEVIAAKDGMDAIEILQETMPDLMLLDIEMPRMDGFEVVTQVRHSPRLRTLPIIMMTSRTGEKHRKHAFEIGVNDYMGKPFQEIELLKRINSLLAVDGVLVQD